MSVVVWGVLAFLQVVCGSGGVGNSGLCDGGGSGVGRSGGLCVTRGSSGSWMMYVVFAVGATLVGQKGTGTELSFGFTGHFGVRIFVTLEECFWLKSENVTAKTGRAKFLAEVGVSF